MAVAELTTIVKIGEEEFSMLDSPEETSDLVRHEKNHIVGQVDLNVLVNDLGRVGKLVRLAYYATKACGYGKNMVDLKMSIYDLGTDVTKLCALSAHTVSSFRSASRDVMLELHGAYEYLLEGLEEDGMDCFDELTVTAEKMAAEAKILQENFEDKRKEVRDTIQKLEEIEDERSGDKKATADRRSTLRAEVTAYEEKLKKLKMLEEGAKQKKEHYEKKRDLEIEKYEEPEFWKAVARKITGSKDPAKEKAKEWRDESVKLYEVEKQQRELQNEMLDKEMSALAEIGNCQIVEGDITIAIKCLQAASGALMALAAVMMEAVEFWKQMESQCRAITDQRFKTLIQKKIEKSEDERSKFWYSKGFKAKAVRYCSKWVALHSVCSDYINGIQLTQKSLMKYITENPSMEDAQLQVPIMVTDLKKETLELKSANSKRSLEVEEKIKEAQEITDELKEDVIQATLHDEDKTGEPDGSTSHTSLSD